MEIFVVIGIVVVVAFALFKFIGFFFVDYGVHLEMTKESTERIKFKDDKMHWITFKKFLKLYNEQKWDRSEDFRFSHFGHSESGLVSDAGGYIHADIIVIDYIKYSFFPHSFLAFKKWEKKNKI